MPSLELFQLRLAEKVGTTDGPRERFGSLVHPRKCVKKKARKGDEAREGVV